ncbi:uncharacterized protein LOC108118133 [Drosophila eugracilis]|uniref:uncharacterized protein LOC108118133 n=1 Tax=Drosophila eugracilis TaxID=29029 RepID=UPI0007E6867D|nr:uncharacterized protein LOC108118133 [Drosophila eugracilis]
MANNNDKPSRSLNTLSAPLFKKSFPKSFYDGASKKNPERVIKDVNAMLMPSSSKSFRGNYPPKERKTDEKEKYIDDKPLPIPSEWIRDPNFRPISPIKWCFVDDCDIFLPPLDLRKGVPPKASQDEEMAEMQPDFKNQEPGGKTFN